MTRNGKIARLPHGIREEVNQRLRDNVPGSAICKWLNALPEAEAVCKEFAQRRGCAESPITPNQLSEWRRGGFQDWLREQQVLESTREMARWSAKLAEDSGGELSEGVAVLLGGQLLKLLQGMVVFQNIQTPSSKLQNPMDHPAEPCAPPHPDPMTRSLPLARPSRASASGQIPFAASQAAQVLHSAEERETAVQRSEKLESESVNTFQMQGELLRVADPRAEEMEGTVRLLGELVKCLSGIRNGDHNRVRLAQSEKKLALRSELVAMAREKHDQEKAEQEELARKERAEKRRKKNGLSDCGKIEWLRGEMFGQEHLIREKEARLKQDQKDLEILKAKWQIDQSSSNENEVEAEPAEAGTPNGAPSGGESIRVNTSAYDQRAEKKSEPDGPSPGSPMNVNPN